jgi:hypothetical protein
MSVPAPTTSTAAANNVPVPCGAQTDRTAIRPFERGTSPVARQRRGRQAARSSSSGTGTFPARPIKPRGVGPSGPIPS